MAQLSRRASFANETLASGIRGKKLWIDDLKRDIAPEVGIECLVSHPHGAAAQFPRAPIRMTQHLEVLELLSFRHGQGTICLESVLANGGRANERPTGRAKNS